MRLKTQYVLTGEELDSSEINGLLDTAAILKQERNSYATALIHQHLALIFNKPSLRTRFSFTMAMRELGGDVVESISQTSKHEEPEDQMRVVQGYCHAVMIRTSADSILQQMQTVATIPIINGLTDLYHPCQILADLLTLKEKFRSLNSLTLCYLGDGNNVLHSLLLMAPKMGINIHYCCPNDCGPNAVVLKRALDNNHTGNISYFEHPADAVKGAHAVYTDVWNSMGSEPKDEQLFAGFQVNEALMAQAEKEAVFMHCMPMIRGSEVSKTLPDQPCSVIFQQSENRLHVQKALLLSLLSGVL